MISFLKHNISRIPRFFSQLGLYGFSVAFATLLYPFSRMFFSFEPNIAVLKHRSILNYLYLHYKDIINKYADSSTLPNSFIKKDSTIWICWWDGEETMPPLVRVCYKTILLHAGTHPVQLITKFNFRDFITIPDYILKKVESKIITVTHFSNMLRANLLYDYGGIWMDATILVLKDISLDNSAFFTLKAPAKKSKSISLARFAGLSNKSLSFNVNDARDPQTSRWSGFLIAGSKHSQIFAYMRDILYAYWKDHNDQIDYLLYDYTIALGYDNIPAAKKMIDDVPGTEKEKFVLEENLNKEYSEESFSAFSSTTFHKLTWKKKFNTYTKDHKLTIYGYLLNNLSN
jgi:hypothetical protein